jgi:DNA polymerase I-like protein with 3'-5' exonuclease and polymerase domains
MTDSPITFVMPKKRTPRAKVTFNQEEVLQTAFEVEAVIEEDTTPIMWDGTLPEPPMPWMNNHSWRVVTSLGDLQGWWDSVKEDVGNHVPTAYDLLHGTGEVYPKIGFDLETTGLDNRMVRGKCKTHVVGVCLASYAFGGGAYSVVKAPNQFHTVEVPLRQCLGIYIPVAHKRWPYNLDMQSVMALLKEMFESAIIVTANGKFDFLSLQAEAPIITREVTHYDWVETITEPTPILLPQWPFLEDVQTLMFMIDPDRATHGGYGLKALSSEFLKQEMIEFEDITSTGVKKKGSRKNILKTFDSVEPPKALHYAAADAINTLLLSDVLGYIRSQGAGLPFIHQLDTSIIGVQAWIEKQRVLIDRDYLYNLDQFLSLKCAHTLTQIHDIVGFAINPDSTKILGNTLFETMGLPNKGRTAGTKMYPEGNWKTDADSMAELAKENPEIAIFDLIVRYRELRSAYPKKLYDGTDPVDSTAKFAYSATRTPSGRFACSGGEYERDGGAGLNVQAIKALYGTRYSQTRLLEPEFLKRISGLTSSTMFDPALLFWLKNNTVEVDPTEYTTDASKIEYYKSIGTPMLVEGISLSSLKNVPTVVNSHLKLSPDGWVCLIHGCTQCIRNQAYMDKDASRAYAYDTSETMNLRRAFIAQPGFTFFSIDYAAIELRMVTNFAKEQLWIDGFNGGTDLHSSMAEAIFKEKFTNADPATRSHLRSQSKTVTFGCLFGGSSRTIQANLPEKIDIQEAKNLYQNWISAIPGYQQWVVDQQSHVRSTGCVFTALGRQRVMLREIQSKDKPTIAYAERTALNHPAQGTAADILRLALVRIKDFIVNNAVDDVVKMHYHVHDELDFSVKDEWVPYIVPKILNLMKCDDIMTGLLKWPVSLECDVEYGQSWDVKYKFDKASWTGIESLKKFDQNIFRTLFKHISDGNAYTADEYRQSFLTAIYSAWNTTGYQDPYRAFCTAAASPES